MRTLAAAVCTALFAAGTLTGCGADADLEATDSSSGPSTPSTPATSPSDEPTQSVKPAAGPQLTGRGFAFSVPRGWVDVTADSPDGVLASAVNVTEDDVPDMVVVRSVRSKGSTPDALASAATAALLAQGARKVVPGTPVDIAGQQAAHVSAVSDGTGGPARLERYDVAVGSTAYAITFSTSKWKTAERREAMVASILASWRWS